MQRTTRMKSQNITFNNSHKLMSIFFIISNITLPLIECGTGCVWMVLIVCCQSLSSMQLCKFRVMMAHLQRMTFSRTKIPFQSKYFRIIFRRLKPRNSIRLLAHRIIRRSAMPSHASCD